MIHVEQRTTQTLIKIQEEQGLSIAELCNPTVTHTHTHLPLKTAFLCLGVKVSTESLNCSSCLKEWATCRCNQLGGGV